MAGRFLCAEADLIISSLALSCAFRNVFVGNLTAIGSLGMRKYCVRRNLVAKNALKARRPMVI
jgi:hypothetical protein